MRAGSIRTTLIGLASRSDASRNSISDWRVKLFCYAKGSAMAHWHSHDHSGRSHGGAGHGTSDKRRVLLAALLTGTFMVAEAIGGWLTGSLALLRSEEHTS